jgi:hypothetical protein
MNGPQRGALRVAADLQRRYGPLLDRVLRHETQVEAGEVFLMVANGAAQLFDAGDGQSVIVTRLTKEAGGLVCEVTWAAGAMAPLLRRHDEVVEWARRMGADRMRIVGRAGWGRVLPAYRETARIFEMPLGAAEGNGHDGR